MSRKPTDPALRITIAEAALVLGLSKETIKRRISSGELPHYRVGRGPRAPIRLLRSDVEAYAIPGRPAGAPRDAASRTAARSAAAKASRQVSA